MAGRFVRPIEIESVTDLVREDLERLYERRTVPTVKKLRHSHHQVAMMIAFGFTVAEIKDVTGYSDQRITGLRRDPAFQALLQTYEGRAQEALVTKASDGVAKMNELFNSSYRHARDRIEELDEEGELLPLRDAVKIMTETADRIGYGKHSTQTNYNVNFANTLEERIRKRNGPTIVEAEGPPQVVPMIRRRLG